MTDDKGLESLQVWQKAIAFTIGIQKQVLPKLPGEEKWGLCDQLRRSTQSIPANIAEGYGRFYYQDAVWFCYIARGSLEETFSHLSLANKLGYVSQHDFENIDNDIQELRRMLNGYITFLKKSKRGENEPGINLHIHEQPTPYDSELEHYEDE